MIRKLTATALRLIFLCAGLSMLAGCNYFQISPPSKDLGINWVSKAGKSKAQLDADKRECARDARSLSSPAFPGEMRHEAGYMKAFDRCMRAKGWVKE